MAMTIGIFEREGDVVEAIRMLREAGFDQGDLRVVVKNGEAARVLTSDTDVAVEELTGIQAAQEKTPLDGGDFIAVPGQNVSGVSTGTYGYAGGATPAGIVAFDWDGNGDEGAQHVLQDIGIPDDAAESCGQAVRDGRFLLLADEGDESDTNTATLLRHAGATDIVH